MNDQDKVRFKQLMDGLSEYYQQKTTLSRAALQIYFSALSAYAFEQISEAVSKHIQSPGGEFYPKASDIAKHIHGGNITHDQVIASARLADTPFGVLCLIQIGSWDLNNQTDMFYLKQRAEECLQIMPEWKSRAMAGEYTDHEISIMLKHNVNPSQSFIGGLPAPEQKVRQLIDHKVDEVSKAERHKFLIGEVGIGEHLCIEHKPEQSFSESEIAKAKQMISELAAMSGVEEYERCATVEEARAELENKLSERKA